MHPLSPCGLGMGPTSFNRIASKEQICDSRLSSVLVVSSPPLLTNSAPSKKNIWSNCTNCFTEDKCFKCLHLYTALTDQVDLSLRLFLVDYNFLNGSWYSRILSICCWVYIKIYTSYFPETHRSTVSSLIYSREEILHKGKKNLLSLYSLVIFNSFFLF